MSCAALDNSAKHASLVFEVEEMCCGVKGGGEPVGNGEASFFGRILPVALPELQSGSLGSPFCVGMSDVEGYLSFEFGCLLSKFISSFITRDVAMAWAPGD